MRTARMLARLAPPLYVAGRVDEGARYVEEAVAINREIGYQFGLVESLHILAGAYRERGDLAGSQELLEESLRIAREIDDELWISWDLGLLAYIARLRGDLERGLGARLRRCPPGAAAQGPSSTLLSGARRAGRGRGPARATAAGPGSSGARPSGSTPSSEPSLFGADARELEPELGERDAVFEARRGGRATRSSSTSCSNALTSVP